jgi:signal peptidase I
VRRVRRTVGLLVTVILTGTAASLLLAVVPAFGNTALIVRSGSMEPDIGVGDLVVTRPVPSYKVGDVIAFRSAASDAVVVTHRIVGVTDEGFVTKGDANEEVDEALVTLERVLGRQLVTMPYVGRVLSLGKTRNGFLAFVIVPALLVIFGDARAIVREVYMKRRRQVAPPAPEAPAVQPAPRPVPNIVSGMALSLQRSLAPRVPARVFVDSVVAKLVLLIISVSVTIPSALALYTDTEVSVGNLFAAGCWTLPPAPVQIHPLDGTIAGPNSHWVADPFLDWEDVESPCGGTVQYQYQSAHNDTFTPAVFTSGLLSTSEIPAPGTPDALYYWHVRATTDGGATFGDWSETWTLLVDRSLVTADHVVISEVQRRGDNNQDDFVELYNPTGGDIDLDNWDLRVRNSAGTESSLIADLGGTIEAHGYYLWASTDNGFAAAVDADASNGNNLAGDSSVALRNVAEEIVDQVAWGSGGGTQFVEGTAFPTNPDSNRSLERKAVSDSTAVSMGSGGVDELRGNGFDSDGNSADFVLRDTSQPQNTSSSPETL